MTKTTLALVVLMLASACAGIPSGRLFPSPDPGMIVVGKTDKTFLLRVVGDPFQVGLDSGDQTWRWYFARRGTTTESSKELNVRFNADGTVKAFSFLSNFPEDMARMK